MRTTAPWRPNKRPARRVESGSGLGKAPQRMQQLAPGSRVLEGRLLNGRPSAAELTTWVEGLGL